MFPFSSRILIVDDLESLRELLKAYLQRLGFRAIDEAYDGQNALDMMWEAEHVKAPYAIVISDWNMPNMTGLDLLLRVRQVEGWKKLPFILLTTESEKDKIVSAVTAGVSNYMVKPVEEAMLKDKLQKVWEKKQKG
jgi:two-component system, chemotaxis family, chemotaxis protein CheY